MTFALVIASSCLFGFGVAETWHRITVRRYRCTRKREALVAEFMDKQIWQFLSLDEWLDGNRGEAGKARQAGRKGQE